LIDVLFNFAVKRQIDQDSRVLFAITCEI